MIAAIIGLCLIAAIASLCLGLAARKFAIKVDPKVEMVEEELPGANCGGCGYAGCHDLAKAAGKNPQEASRCLLITKENLCRIGEALECDLSLGEKKVARLHCRGGKPQAKAKFDYVDVLDCVAATHLWEGPKMCEEGCLGFGTCAFVCPFDAITMSDDHLPVIDEYKCTGCGTCAGSCPRNVLEIVPQSTKVFIHCQSHLKGGQIRKVCQVGCIGCKKCEKACDFEAIKVIDNLAVIDNTKCTQCGQCALVCPTKCLINQALSKEEEGIFAP